MADDDSPDLSTVDGCERAFGKANHSTNATTERAGSVFCARCGARRIVDARHVASDRFHADARRGTALWILTCRQCHSPFTLLEFNSANGREVACLPSVWGGLSTPHAPAAVTYYLDQAHRAQCLSARSAAVAMYRAALEQLLFDQGFKRGMLNQKIEDLEKGVKDGSAPKWARELDVEYLRAIKDLGNTAIHPNDGDIEKQAALDDSLVSEVEIVFSALLTEVYELEHTRKEQLMKLRAAAPLKR